MINEEKASSKSFKEEYVSGLEAFIAQRESEYAAKREKYIKDIFSDPERYRGEFKRMLGFPLVGYEKSGLPSVTSELVGEDDGHIITRMSFDILCGIKMTGLLFKKKDDKKRPMVIIQHGGQGTPEHISGLYGSTTNYNDMLARVIKYDVNAFAPQLLLWKQDEYGVDYDRQQIDARLKRLGGSITALEIFGIERIMDYFEAQDFVKKFGMVGLSYGGFYTLFTAACDTRVKAAVSTCYFNDRSKLGWTDWCWNDAAEKFYDAEVACLVYPRHISVEVGENDPLFIFENAEKEYERLLKLSSGMPSGWFEFKHFNGVHEFGKSDESIEKLINELYEQ